MSNDPIDMAIKALELSLPCVRAGSISLPDDDIKELYEQHERALTALRQHQQDGGWRPIESAPKDGTTVLLRREGHTFCGYYGGGNSGWRFNVGTRDIVYPLPTLWQPLPPAPKKENDDG